MPADDPPQHLLGGLNVALLVTETSDPAQVLATRHALEESGVNVTLLSTTRGRPSDPRLAGEAAALSASLALSQADPEGFDGVVVLADARGARKLRGEPHAAPFLARIDAAAKPVAAVTDGVLLLAAGGLSGDRALGAPDAVAREVADSGGRVSDQPLVADGNWLSAARAEVLPEFLLRLKHLLAQRRLATITPGNDTPSATGEDG